MATELDLVYAKQLRLRFKSCLGKLGGPSAPFGKPVVTPIPRVLEEPSQSRDLKERGYTIQPFLDENDIQALSQLHRETTPVVPADFYITAFATGITTKRRILDGIWAIVEAKVRGLTPGYRLLNASFVTKRANSVHGRIGLHQDYSTVDHASAVGLNIWAPFCDVDNRNGCLKVVAGSQAFGHICATTLNPSPYDGVRKELESRFTAEVPMPGGSAFLFDTRLLHATDENQTNLDRTAILLSLVPEHRTPRLYQWNKQKPEKLEVYEVDCEFLLRLPPNQYLKNAEAMGARRVSDLEYRRPMLTSADLRRLLPAGSDYQYRGTA